MHWLETERRPGSCAARIRDACFAWTSDACTRVFEFAMRRWVYACTCTSPERYPRQTSAPCKMRAYASVLAHAYVVIYGAAAVTLGRSRPPRTSFAPVATNKRQAAELNRLYANAAHPECEFMLSARVVAHAWIRIRMCYNE